VNADDVDLIENLKFHGTKILLLIIEFRRNSI
jgi:hypothetical protein